MTAPRMISAYVTLPDGLRASLVCIDTFWKTEGAFILELANDTHEESTMTGLWRLESNDEAGTVFSLEDDGRGDDVDQDIVNELLRSLLSEHGDAWGFESVEEFS